MVKKSLFISFVSMFIFLTASYGQQWQHSWNETTSLSQKEHKHILLNFSGSDWCLPCMRMHKNVFGSNEFTAFASQNLVMYNADFPRNKKNQLNKEIEKQNNALADLYNKEGHFPFTVLLDSNGKVLKQWNGLYTGSVENFIAEIKSL
ncbi:thioredoxin family protein [Paludibacter jiangxiensis]|uniref:Thioredoxin-like n=1 Tax=Paludibacter jiangxiensis TaxID=681398 RepID=A0A171ASR5_9BACT|nr:thioredoxin family protein [Paludibacter jiangxiensis]GAT64218.1 thioredoxin-like [Paludibacter jiangxiensis]